MKNGFCLQSLFLLSVIRKVSSVSGKLGSVPNVLLACMFVQKLRVAGERRRNRLGPATSAKCVTVLLFFLMCRRTAGISCPTLSSLILCNTFEEMASIL